MTIDERIEKLAERHEALTQTVELMILENRERDAKFAERDARLAERDAKLAERDAKLAERDAKIGTLVIQVVESVQKLAVIVESHERRITHLEGEAQA
jgi:hypothetical protein